MSAVPGPSVSVNFLPTSSKLSLREVGLGYSLYYTAQWRKAEAPPKENKSLTGLKKKGMEKGFLFS